MIIFSFIIAFSIQKMSQAFAIVSKIEKITRVIVASTFLMVGLYYTQYLIKFII